MKKFALVSSFVGSLVVGATVGALAGGWWSCRVYARMEYAKPEVDLGFQAAQEAEWAAELRLNETNSAIAHLENSINIQLATIASWDTVAPPNERTRKARDKFLTAVKTYRESYPASGKEAARINALLSTVPGRNPQSICKDGVCRLDDLRLAKLHSTANSP